MHAQTLPSSLLSVLLDLAKVLLSEDDGEKLPEVLLQRVIQATGAHRGFIVVREGGSFEQRFAVRFERDSHDRDRKFSRTLVRRAIETGQITRATIEASPDGIEQSFRASGAALALAAPLSVEGEIHGVVYIDYALDAPAASGASAIGRDALIPFLEDLAALAAGHLKRALIQDSLRRRAQELEKDLFKRYDFRGIVTHDPAMARLLETVAQVADSDATVLLTGETGTGKELIARAVHENSRRRGKPYVPLHASALPSTLVEAELFGHVKGAFTGADRERTGRFASAHTGTLFLDEVAEIPMDVQAKLLRALQFGEIQRAGSDKVEKVDVRIVAATHQDLAKMVEAGKLRRDLYYRLKVIELTIPPLRERRGDILLLASHFARQHWTRPGEPSFSPEAERVLFRYPYPGNIRELSHAVQRACVLSREPRIEAGVLPPEMLSGDGLSVPQDKRPPVFGELTLDALNEARQAAVGDVEQAFVDALMARHDSNVSLAARESGLNRTYLQKLLSRYRKGDPGGLT